MLMLSISRPNSSVLEQKQRPGGRRSFNGDLKHVKGQESESVW